MPMYKYLHNLLNAFVQIANRMGLQIKNFSSGWKDRINKINLEIYMEE
jgi:hypothetical protein